jgi:secreted Zn-dependent insulinase-like peptidase
MYSDNVFFKKMHSDNVLVIIFGNLKNYKRKFIYLFTFNEIANIFRVGVVFIFYQMGGFLLE